MGKITSRALILCILLLLFACKTDDEKKPSPDPGTPGPPEPALSSVLGRWSVTVDHKGISKDNNYVFYNASIEGHFDIGEKSMSTHDDYPLTGEGTVHVTSSSRGGHWVYVHYDSREEVTCPDSSISTSGKVRFSGFVRKDGVRLIIHPVDKIEKKGEYECTVHITEYLPAGETREFTVKREKKKSVKFGGMGQRDFPLKNGSHDRSLYDDDGFKSFVLVYTLSQVDSKVPECKISRKNPATSLPPMSCQGDKYVPEYSLVLSAPEGGTNYLWSVVKGGDKIKRDSPTESHFNIALFELVAPSDQRKDITIKLNYFHGGEERTCETDLTIPYPAKLNVEEEIVLPLTEDVSDTGVIKWMYGIERRYKVLDKFNFPIVGYEMEASERLTGIDLNGQQVSWTSGSQGLSYNPNDLGLVGPSAPSLDITANAKWTDMDGIFSDNVGVQRIGIPFPDNTNAEVLQEMFIDGCLVRKNSLHYGPESLQINQIPH